MENGNEQGYAGVYDIVGVGFGPSNLALAVALAEQRDSQPLQVPLSAAFLEQKERFGWHGGMLLEDATMQVSFLKDLATLRNPTSRYSFLAYLAAKNRLVDFINQKTFFPTRLEFHDYLEWAAGYFTELVDYSTRVMTVRPVWGDHSVSSLEIVAEKTTGGNRRTLTWRTRNLVLGTGLFPVMPPGVEPTDRVWHSSQLLSRTATAQADKPYQFVVVGAGQSAAEVVRYLHGRFENANVHAVFGRYGYSIADDTAFANRVFDPAAVDDYYYAPDPVKQQFLRYHGNTNYSVVDADLIEDLYSRMYREGVAGRRRLHLHNVSEVTRQSAVSDKLSVTIRNLATGEMRNVLADHVIYATGYRPVDPVGLLGEAAELCQRDDAGRLLVQRDYRVRTIPEATCGIYLQGATEHSHGISSSLLSNVAVRAGEIAASIGWNEPSDADFLGSMAHAFDVKDDDSVHV